MELIAEAYQLMKLGLGMTADEMHEVFAKWNETELDSFLIEITRDILAYRDEDGEPLVEKILDAAGQKGTGKWTGIDALQLGVPVTLIVEAVFARALSARKEDRVAAAKVLKGPEPEFDGDRSAFVEDIRRALLASKIISYTQGFMQMQEASSEYDWSINYGSVADMWRGGCIIRAQFLDRIKEAFDEQPDLENLLLYPYFEKALEDAQAGWRAVVSAASLLGIPVPAFGAALNYYDGYRLARLPANLLQAQRDYFGAHTYQRVDRDGTFHSEWLDLRKTPKA